MSIQVCKFAVEKSLQQLDLQFGLVHRLYIKSFLNQEKIKILGKNLENIGKGESESKLDCGFSLTHPAFQ